VVIILLNPQLFLASSVVKFKGISAEWEEERDN
jgi:hypothetical protein